MLHSDLNRDNVLAFGRGGELRAFLIDLGAATVVERWPEDRANSNCVFAGLIRGCAPPPNITYCLLYTSPSPRD